MNPWYLMLRLYRPQRLYAVFRFLLTIFLLIKRREHLMGLRPLGPVALVRCIHELGASFIKLAQVLATRADFFDEPYLEELRNLHDSIPPMKSADYRAVYERAFGDGGCFAEFDSEPFASASIGQVHRARLAADGAEVAVKLRRNHIEVVVREDIRILNFFLWLFRPLFSEYTKNSIEAVLDAFAHMILREVDMSVERSNLEKFRQVYANCNVRFPRSYAACSSREALVMSFEQGHRFDDKAALQRLDISFEDLMSRLVVFYVEQALVKGYFHADPHPGNLLVTDSGELVMLDFGMVTRIPNKTRIATISVVKAAWERDYETMIIAAKQLGIVTDDAPTAELEELVERIFDIFDDASLSASSMQQLGFDLLYSMKNMPFKVPQESVYLMRVSSIIEGLGTNYIENFNGIKDILPILKENLGRALGEQGYGIRQVRDEVRNLPLTYLKLRKIIDQMHDAEFHVRLAREDKQQLLSELKRFFRQVLVAVFMLSCGIYIQNTELPLADLVALVFFVLGAARIFFLV